MGIEKDINQVNFRSNYQKGLINLIFTANWANEQLKEIFDRENITSQQFNILRILRGSPEPLSTLQIRERMLDKMSDTSRIVDRLLLKSLVKKTTCPADKRLVDVSITEKGRKLLEKLDTFEDDISGIMQNLSESEIKTFNRLLDKVRDK